MSEPEARDIDRRRRQFLARLGAAMGTAYLAPAMAQLGLARASDSFSASGGSSDSSSSDTGTGWPSTPSRPRQTRQVASRRAPEILVATTRPADLDGLGGLGFRVLASEHSALLGVTLARLALPAQVALPAAMDLLRRHLPDARVTENTFYQTSEMPCADGDCAAFELIGWRPTGACDAAPVIGMIDTGVNPGHEALSGQKLEIITLDQAERDPAGRVHGTAIATLLLGRSDSRTPGLLPNARLVAAEAFFSDAVGEAADSFSLIRALEALLDRGATVINMSFAGPPNPLLDDALRAVTARGTGLVAAAGNGGPAADPAFPAAHADVVAVTAVDRRLSVYRQAASGNHIGLSAPGVRVWTAASISGGRFRSGTSFAAPFVTAAMAVAALETPGTAPADLAETLTGTAQDLGDPGRDDVFGWGLVQTAELCTA